MNIFFNFGKCVSSKELGPVDKLEIMILYQDHIVFSSNKKMY